MIKKKVIELFFANLGLRWFELMSQVQMKNMLIPITRKIYAKQSKLEIFITTLLPKVYRIV